MTKHDDQKPKQKGHKPVHHQKKVFDVVRPGKAPASPNSRSVIVGHKPQVHDDQFVLSEHWAGDPREKRPLMDGRKKLTLAPGDGGEEKPKKEVAPKDGGEKLAGAASTPATPTAEKTADATPKVEPTVSNSPAAAEVEAMPASPETADKKGQIDPRDPKLVALEHLIVEQVVEEPIAASAPDSVRDDSEQPNAISNETTTTILSDKDTPDDDFWDKFDSSAHSSQSAADDLLAQTDAPAIEPQKAVVSQHHRRAAAWEMILIFLLVLLVGVIALNFLLDADIIKTDLQLPHTELIGD